MNTIPFDTGLKAYKLGSGVLRFHPGDPNVYARFLEGAEKLRKVEEALRGTPEEGWVAALQRADEEMKGILGWIFGPGNDFEAILSGVNLLAVGENGKLLVTNLFEALEPVLTEGAERCAAAVAAQAKADRDAR